MWDTYGTESMTQTWFLASSDTHGSYTTGSLLVTHKITSVLSPINFSIYQPIESFLQLSTRSTLGCPLVAEVCITFKHQKIFQSHSVFNYVLSSWCKVSERHNLYLLSHLKYPSQFKQGLAHGRCPVSIRWMTETVSKPSCPHLAVQWACSVRLFRVFLLVSMCGVWLKLLSQLINGNSAPASPQRNELRVQLQPEYI